MRFTHLDSGFGDGRMVSGMLGAEITHVRPGEVLAGKYRVERVLGAGGMGVVVAAHHIQLDEKVALKFLLPEALGNAEATARFIREARAAVKIKSEHVASVKDVGTLPNGAPYMVMEYLEGGDLAGWVKQRGALPIDQAVEFVIQACVAVAEAHGLGIVHRDLKPANLFCVRRADGQLSIKVLDFGISKMTDPAASGPGMMMTKTAALMGSPLYMSPEQMRSSKDVDAGTDIWALGVILFELVTGRPPFMGDSVPEVAIKIAMEPPPSMRAFRPDVPAGLEAVVFKSLEKNRATRYRNVGELSLALLPFAPKRAKASVERISGIVQSAGMSTSALAVPASPPADATQASPGTLPPFGRTTVAGGKGRRTLLGTGILVALLVVGVGTSFFVLRRASDVPGIQAAAPPGPTAASVLPAALSASVTTAQGTTSPATSPSTGAVLAALPSLAEVPSAPPAPPKPVPLPKVSAVHSPVPVAVPAVRATEPVAAPAAAAPKPDCDPPYIIDAAGHRQYKPECLK
jgi:serine/threonine-protein kinase